MVALGSFTKPCSTEAPLRAHVGERHLSTTTATVLAIIASPTHISSSFLLERETYNILLKSRIRRAGSLVAAGQVIRAAARLLKLLAGKQRDKVHGSVNTINC